MMAFRRLGRSGLQVSPMGLGTARLGGLGWREDRPVQDASARREAVRQIRAAVDLGVTFFDTAESYGQGWCESILGEALQGRADILVGTKFGEDPMPDQEDPWHLSASCVARKCAASLRRLGRECIDLYLLHRRDYPLERAPALLQVLEDLVLAGKIRYYGWSTDDVHRVRLFAAGAHCSAVEHRLNIVNQSAEMLELCQQQDLASLNRGPLLMGVLTGRWTAETQLEQDDPRAAWFADAEFQKLLALARQIEPYLTRAGRSYVQGAIAWIWACSPLAIPLPGFRNMAQMLELIQAQHFGPLPLADLQAINEEVQRAGFGRYP